MMFRELFRPKRRIWFAASVGTGAATIVGAAAVKWWRGMSPGDAMGLTFGGAATGLMFVAALYPWRRRLARFPLRTAQDWLQFHLYGSTLAALFVIVHMGFRWPGGQFGWWLLGLTVWTTASGLMGVFLQKWIPLMLADQLTVEAIFERIPELVGAIRREAEVLMTGSPDVLARFYESQVRRSFLALEPSWSYLLDVHSGRDRRLAAFQHMHAFVPEDHRSRLVDLQTLMMEKLELDAHYTLQRLLRLWPIAHVPPAMVLLFAIVGHIAAVWAY